MKPEVIRYKFLSVSCCGWRLLLQRWC